MVLFIAFYLQFCATATEWHYASSDILRIFQITLFLLHHLLSVLVRVYLVKMSQVGNIIGKPKAKYNHCEGLTLDYCSIIKVIIKAGRQSLEQVVGRTCK